MRWCQNAVRFYLAIHLTILCPILLHTFSEQLWRRAITFGTETLHLRDPTTAWE